MFNSPSTLATVPQLVCAVSGGEMSSTSGQQMFGQSGRALPQTKPSCPTFQPLHPHKPPLNVPQAQITFKSRKRTVLLPL